MNESNEFLISNNGTNPLDLLKALQDLERQKGLEILILFPITSFGIIGNFIVCLAILLDRKLRTAKNYFLLSLAVNDQLICVFVYSVRMLRFMYDYSLQPSEYPLCILVVVDDVFLTTASNIHICWMGIERYLAIKNPLYGRNLSKKKVAIKIALIWAISSLTVIPFVVMATVSGKITEMYLPMSCVRQLVFVVSKDVVVIEGFILVLNALLEVLSFILTTNVLYRLVKQQETNISNGLIRTAGGKRTGDETNKERALQNLQSEKKALRVVWLMSLVAIICVLPDACVNLLTYFRPGIQFPAALWSIKNLLTFLSPALHPIIYTIFSKDFRNTFKKIFLCTLKVK